MYKGDLRDLPSLGCCVAVKLFNANTRTNHKADAKMFQSRHPNLLQIYGMGKIWDPIGGCSRICTVAEVMKGGSLRHCLDKRGHVSWSSRLVAVRDTCVALCYLWEQRKLPHGDIKAENILFDARQQVAVLSDTGSAHFGSENRGLAAMSKVYMSPELIRSKAAGRFVQFTSSMDIYSLGVVLLEIATGDQASTATGNLVEKMTPFLTVFVDTRNDAALIQHVDNHLDLHPISASIPVFTLASECLRHEADQRPSASAVLAQISKLLRKHEEILLDKDNGRLAQLIDNYNLSSAQREMLNLLEVQVDSHNHNGSDQRSNYNLIGAKLQKLNSMVNQGPTFRPLSERPCGLLLQYCFAFLERMPAVTESVAHDDRPQQLWKVLQNCSQLYFDEQIRQIDQIPTEMDKIETCVQILQKDSGHEAMYHHVMEEIRREHAFQRFVEDFTDLETKLQGLSPAQSETDIFKNYQHGRDILPKYTAFIKQLAVGTEFKTAPLKRLYRSVEKIGLRVKGRWDGSALTDIVRGTLVIPTDKWSSGREFLRYLIACDETLGVESDFNRAFKTKIKIVAVKNRWTEENAAQGGWHCGQVYFHFVNDRHDIFANSRLFTS